MGGRSSSSDKLRKEVDHGQYAKNADVDAGTVARMIGGVRDFVARFRQTGAGTSNEMQEATSAGTGRTSAASNRRRGCDRRDVR